MLLAWSLCVSSAQAQPADSKPLAIVHVSVIDVTAGAPQPDMTVIVNGNRIEAGLTPPEALRAATIHAAAFLGKDKEFGTVAVGKLADLVLLDASPLNDIHNTQKISAVVSNGRWLDRRALDEVLAKVEAAASQK